MEIKQALVLGHSFINHLARFIDSNYEPSINSNFDLDRSKIRIDMDGLSGCNIERFRRTFLWRIPDFSPDILYIELGTNDLDNVWAHPDDVAADIVDLVQDINRICFGKTTIIVGQVLRRGPGGSRDPYFNNKVEAYNRMAGDLINAMPFSVFWRHVRMFNSVLPLLKSDQVHPNREGLHRLYRSIRGALWHSV